MTHATRIRVAIVDDHAIVREGIIRQLTADNALQVVMEAKHGHDLLEQLKNAAVPPDIAVIDISMPVMDGFTLSEELQTQYPSIKVLVLTAYVSEYNLALMVSNGIRGYLMKVAPPTDLINAIHAIYETGYYYSNELSEHTFRILQARNSKSKPFNIPEREMEFLKLCCTDLRYDQIAKEMNISINTLDGCRKRLFDRLGVSNRQGLMLFALESGIVNSQSNSHNKFNIK
jgi:DNA-binding NarL/FixJ family response regulator